MIASRFSPITQGPSPDENSIAWLNIHLLPLQCFSQVSGVDHGRVLESVNLLITGHVNQHGAQYHGRNCGDVGFANPPIPSPVSFLEAVVPMIVIPGCNVTESVNLSCYVIVDEQSGTVPAESRGIGCWQGEGEVFLPFHTFRSSKRENLPGRMTGPLEGGSIVGNSQVVYFPLLNEAQGTQDSLRSHRVQGSHFIVLAPDPAPALTFFPASNLRFLAKTNTSTYKHPQ